MYTDILRSYSTAAIGGPNSSRTHSYGNDWFTRPSSREPVKLKLSILSDIDPNTRSVLNGDATGRSYSTVWSPAGGDHYPKNRSDQNGYTLAVVGIKRANSEWNHNNSDSYDAYDASKSCTDILSITPTAQRRNRIKSEPNSGYKKSTFSQPCQKNGYESNVNGYYSHEKNRTPAEELDMDDEFDEVFASILRRAMSEDLRSEKPTSPPKSLKYYRDPNIAQSTTFPISNGVSTAGVNNLHKTQSWRGECETQQNLGQQQNRERSRVQHECGGVEYSLKNYAPSQGNNQNSSHTASSYENQHPYYYRSAIPTPGRQYSKPLLEQNPPHQKSYVQKSEPYLHGVNGKRLEKSYETKIPRNDERLASSVKSYYVEDITIPSTVKRRLLSDTNTQIPSGGKLRSAKSESSLRMAAKELLLSDKEIYQIEIMNSGLSASKVYVCQCLANLYFDDGSSSSSTGSISKRNQNAWRHVATGVPVLVLECGSSKTPRRLLIRLAELGNGFKLWEDVIDAFSAYAVDRTFHTMSTSADTNRLAGLSFDNQSAALKFHQHVREFNEELDSFSTDAMDNCRRRQNKGIFNAFKKMAALDAHASNGSIYGISKKSSQCTQDTNGMRKTDISMPCCFKHVTSLKAGDILPRSMLINNSNDHSPPTTLTRVNRSATIKSKSQLPISDDHCAISAPKRAQSCTQILANGGNHHLMAYDSHEYMNTMNGNSYIPNGKSNSLRYARSVEPVI